MISLDPDSRLSCAEYLANARGTSFPEVFYTFLHPFLLSLNDHSASPAQPAPSTPSSAGAGPSGPTTRPSIATAAPTPEPQALLRTDADDKIERVWNEWEMIAGYLDEGQHPKEDRRPEAAETSRAGRGEGVFPIRLHVPGLEGEIAQPGATKGKREWLMWYILSPLTEMVYRRWSCTYSAVAAVRQYSQLPTPWLDPPRAGRPPRLEWIPY